MEVSMNFSKKIGLLILIINLFSSIVYAQDTEQLCSEVNNLETPCLARVTKSSDIPEKRKYPVNIHVLIFINMCVLQQL
jgi:hypothetical protein